jgi:hypothetical protein
MYTLSDEERLRFLTEQYIPVKTLIEDDGSLQWQVQSAAVQGSIETVLVTYSGSGYDANNPPTITIATTGIDRVLITNKGSGYTYANAIISTATSNSALIRPIMSPPGGHGSNPAEELGGSYAIINTRLRGTEDGVLDVENEFRQTSLIKNPYLLNTKNLASNLVYSQTTTLFMDAGISNYSEDEYVYQGPNLETASFRGTVASWDPINNILQVIDTIGNPTTDILTGNSSKVSRYVESVTAKDLQPYSGSLLYINNITPIQRAADQTEDFKIVISF